MQARQEEFGRLARDKAIFVAKEKPIVEHRVLELALPLDEDAKSIADKSAKLVAAALEHYTSIISVDQDSSDHVLAEQLCSLETRSRLCALAGGCVPWLSPSVDLDREKAKNKPDKPLYAQFRDLVLFAMECLQALVPEPSTADHYRLLLPCSKSGDFKPLDSPDDCRVDQALFLREWGSKIGDGVNEPRYADMLAVVEAKVAGSVRSASRTASASNMANQSSASEHCLPKLAMAQEQTVRYSRNIYEIQHSRMFLWGLALCGPCIRIYLFGPDCVLSSEDLDVTLPSGRKQFVEWLVNMCLCEDHRRGFIPSMAFKTPDGDKPYWEISAPAIDNNGNETGKQAVFYSRKPTVKAGSTLGRHTRGFPASTELANIDSPHLFVKVAWQHVEREPEQQQWSESKSTCR
ncbi:hypothetical protein EV174_004228, partial [Coemansia sp. RSA 2320]